MAVEVLLPKLGMTMELGKLIEWTKKDTEAVSKGEVICIIETDKVTFEVESPGTGWLLILMAPSDNIPVGTLIAYIAESEAECASLRPSVSKAGSDAVLSTKEISVSAANTQVEEPCSYDADYPEKQRASPAARSLAQKHGFALSACIGKGPRGRITRQDVEKAIQAPKTPQDTRPTETARPFDASPGARKVAEERNLSLSTIPGTGIDGRIMRRDVIRASQATAGRPATPDATADPVGFKGKRLLKPEPMTSIRQTIATRMTRSLSTTAQMTAFSEWDVTHLKRLRHTLNLKAAQEGFKICFPGLMVFFLARVIKAMPVFNASVEGNSIQYWRDINIGVAVAVGDNLLVPVIHGADQKSLKDLQATLDGLIERARSRRLLPDDMQGGTFTLSNLGSYGSQWETVILNPPEVGLLGTGAIEKKPVVVQNEIVVRDMMPISLTFDHRLIDGATAGEFRNRMKQLVEMPEQIIAYFHPNAPSMENV